MNATLNILSKRSTIFSFLLVCLLVFLSQGYNLAIYTLLALVAFYLLDKNFLKKVKRLNYQILIPFWIYFLLHLVGVLYSENTVDAWREIEIALPFLVLPTLLLTESIPKKNLERVFVVFKYWLLLFGLFLIINQVFTDGRSLWTLPYFSLKSNTNIHQFYISQFYFLTLLFILYQSNEGKINRFIAALQVFVFLFFIVLLSSGPTMLISLLVVAISALIFVKKWYFKLSLIVILLLSLFMVKDTRFVKKKLHRIANIEWNLEKNIEKHQLVYTSEFKAYNTLELRLLKWYVANEIIKQNFWIGVGSGDFQDALNKGYEDIQFHNGIKHHYNAHNQYLESGIKFGIFGILTLLFLFGQHLFIAYKEKNVLLAIIILFIVFSALIESVFARFHGVTFYAISVPLLYQLKKLKNEEK